MIDYFERKLDDKNRLTIPAELRNEFEGGNVIITPGFSGDYLHLYTEKTWDNEMESALRGNILDERIADLNEMLRAGKSVAAMDHKQGRITIEAHLLAHAKIVKDVKATRITTEQGSYWRLRAKSA